MMTRDFRLMSAIIKVKNCCQEREANIQKALGLNSSEYLCMVEVPLGQHIGTGELCRRMGLSPSRGSRVIDRVFSKGYLLRTPSVADRRVIEIELSPSGRRAKRKIDELLTVCEATFAGSLDAGERESIIAALNTLLVSAEKGEKP